MELSKEHKGPLKSARILVVDHNGAVEKIITKQNSHKPKF